MVAHGISELALVNLENLMEQVRSHVLRSGEWKHAKLRRAYKSRSMGTSEKRTGRELVIEAHAGSFLHWWKVPYQTMMYTKEAVNGNTALES